MPPRIRSPSTYGGRSPDLPRTLRRASTDAEGLLWRHLRNGGLNGLKFRRQQPIGAYIVDFYCHKQGIVVEVDGSQHLDPDHAEADEERTRWLETRGIRVLRFDNRQVLREIDGVLARIWECVSNDDGLPSPQPSP